MVLSQTGCRRGTKPRSQIRRHVYRVFGFTVESEIELPELATAANTAPDVCVRFGNVPGTLVDQIGEWSWCSASRNEFAFTIDGVARYHVSQGKTITIERRLKPSEPIPASDIRLWLLGSAFGALLHQRALLPLHVSAVKAPAGIWAFTGGSGEGKSTLAGFLHKKFGWDLISDDVSVLDTKIDHVSIYPGPRKLKLWADALERLGFDDRPCLQDLSTTDKFQIYLADEQAVESAPLAGLVILESSPADGGSAITKLNGVEAFNACLAAIYRPYMGAWFKLPHQRLAEIVNLCSSIEVYRFRRPRSLRNFRQNLGPLLDLIARERS